MTGILRDAGRTLTDPENAEKRGTGYFLKKIPARQQKQGEKTWI
jgi:hypothetical protein